MPTRNKKPRRLIHIARRELKPKSIGTFWAIASQVINDVTACGRVVADMDTTYVPSLVSCYYCNKKIRLNQVLYGTIAWGEDVSINVNELNEINGKVLSNE